MASESDMPTATTSTDVSHKNADAAEREIASAHAEPKENGAAEPTAVAEPTGRALAKTRPPKDPRFHIFVIDSGWNSPASKALRKNLHVLGDLNEDDELFILDRETSVALLRHYPKQVGRDPIITVHDRRAPHRHRVRHTHGFRVHFGSLNTEDQVLGTLRMLAGFLLSHRDEKDLEKMVRKNLHREGIAGAIEIMGGHEHQKLIEE